MKHYVSDASKNNKNKKFSAASSGIKKESVSKMSATTIPVPNPAKFAQSIGGSNAIVAQPMFFSPLHTPQNWQMASKRREIMMWNRFFYGNEPKVAAGVDFTSLFPMNGFKLTCKSKKILKFYQRKVEQLKLNYWSKAISFEYHLIGDVFPFLQIECPRCQNTGFLEDGVTCDHKDGDISRIVILNPDWIEVNQTVLSKEPQILLIPDDELKQIIAKKEPAYIYQNLPPDLIQNISSGRPIQLSNRVTSHIKHMGSPYGTYGTSLLQRLFSVLMYKTKIMTANWIIAERLILPIRIAKVGSNERPASQDDLQEVANQLSSVANDPNLTLVTHHNLEIDWVGASGKIQTITQELEYIGKEILDGLMLNQAILNGEMSSYSGMATGIEVMIRRLESWRTTLKEWIEEHIFLPIAMMKGFIDKEESEEAGETVYLYPRIKWNDLNLRDRTNIRQGLNQLHDKKLCSGQTLLEEFDLNYDQEIERIREETLMAGPSGQIQGGQGGSTGGMDMMGLGGGGGGAPPPMDMGGMGGTPPAGEAGMGQPTPPMGDMSSGSPSPSGGASPTASSLKITKRGKGGKKEEQAQQMPVMKPLILTSLERRMLNALKTMSPQIPYKLFAQYELKVPGGQRPFKLDFAYPDIGVCVEVNGDIWHQYEENKDRDVQRDQKLANVGWRILRFNEDAITDSIDEVKKVVYANIVEAAKDKNNRIKKAEYENFLIKLASNEGIDGIKSEDIIMPNKLGVITLIGT